MKKPFKRKETTVESNSEPKMTTNEEPLTRLNKFIANAGVCSRRDADILIADGRIQVNGKVITEMGFKVKQGDSVLFDDQQLSTEKLVYVLLNKPKNYITTMEDTHGRNTVMDIVGDACKERIYPVGRLDRNTTGLLLFTNDGELAETLSHPSRQVKKIYEVHLDKPIEEEDYIEIQKGVKLEDGLVKVSDIAIISEDQTVLGVEIHVGKNRIVRRIFEHFGYEVSKLDRTIYATLTKKELPRGKWRFLDPKEVIQLKHLRKNKQ